MRVVADNRLSITRRLGQSDIPRNHRLENLEPVEVPQVGSDRRREVGALVVHGEEKPFNHQSGIVQTPDARERVEELGDAFQGVVFTLNGNQERLRGC